MRSGEAVGAELSQMMAAAFPDKICCASCKHPLDYDGNVVILVTIARNPTKSGLPEGTFVGYDGALCSGDCLRVWAADVQEE